MGSILHLAAGREEIPLEKHGCHKVCVFIQYLFEVSYYLQSNWFDNQSAVVLTLGERLEQLEQEKGIVVRFMIGHRYSFVDYFLSSINQ